MSSYSLAYLAKRDLNEGILFTKYKKREITNYAIVYTFADGTELVIPKHGWQNPIVIDNRSNPMKMTG